MTLDGILEEIKAKIKESPLFDGVKITQAYETRKKPTRIENPVISLGIDSVEFSSESVDENERCGEIKVFADIFVPVNGSFSSPQEIFLNICKILSCYNVLSVTAQRMTVDSKTETFLLQTSVCFRDTFNFGGA